jgi:hypothetical protein
MRVLIVTTAACSLAACGGGGGGGGVASTPIPPPPPPPPPPTYPAIFPGVTQTTDFAAIGYEVPDGYQPTLTGDGFGVRYDAAQGKYIMDIPSAPPGAFESLYPDSDSWSGYLHGTSINFDVAKPVSTTRDPDFEFTSMATYYEYDFGAPFFYGAMAFGSATPSTGIPTTGSAVFDAIVAGFAIDSSGGVGGTASLQFDFGAGTLAGSLSPTLLTSNSPPISLGTYTFVNTVFGAGSTTFSGGLQQSGITGLGSFNGLFTGPLAQELMAHWRAPYINPNSHAQSEIVGVWIGRKP